ncbi:response regulator [Polyangium spumosum]|uniref:Response regulator n=1 Tax=Polyangium spumosum TaxID=889282 RepID=A0A6N7PL22_9BACT|nr:response regulator [Polyangium spumosum]MRG92629.1 response regulator [Polyangium spumosum]
MPRGLVLVIEDDEWVSSLLSGAIRDAGYDVIVCSTAQAGLDTACDREPDCIICDIDLPDNDGYWVARNVRTQPSRVSVTPFLFLSALDDQEARLEGFHVGADAYMTKPFRVDEVVAQVGALVQMAWRLRKRRDSLVSVPPSSTTETTAIQGDLSQMSIATVLTVLELERRTGVVEVVSKKRKVQLDVASGFIVSGTIGGTSTDAITILRSILGWKVGRFSFVPQPDRPPSGNAQPIGHLLLEAVRLEDESVHNGEQPRSSKAAPSTRLSAPSMGGPPSRHTDLGPPSSKAFAEAPKPHAPRAAAAAQAQAHAHDDQEAADRKAYYDWADFGMDEPVAAPPSGGRAEAVPGSQELVPESLYGDEAQLVEEPGELTELSAESLDEVDETPASEYQLDEEDLEGAPAYRPNSGGAPRRPGMGLTTTNAGAVRPGAGYGAGPVRPGAMAPRLPGGPPPRLTPPARPAVSAGLPGPPPGRPAPTRTAGGLPGPPPRAPGGATRLPGPPPRQQITPSRTSGEYPAYTRPSAPGPAPRAPGQAPGAHSKSTPPPLPHPGTGTGPVPRSPTPPPRLPTQTRPDLSDSGVRPAPPPLPPRHPQTGPSNDKKR